MSNSVVPPFTQPCKTFVIIIKIEKGVLSYPNFPPPMCTENYHQAEGDKELIRSLIKAKKLTGEAEIPIVYTNRLAKKEPKMARR